MNSIMSFTEKIFELSKEGFKVCFVPSEIGLKVIVYSTKENMIEAEYKGQYPDKLTVSVLEDLKNKLKKRK